MIYTTSCQSPITLNLGQAKIWSESIINILPNKSIGIELESSYENHQLSNIRNFQFIVNMESAINVSYVFILNRLKFSVTSYITENKNFSSPKYSILITCLRKYPLFLPNIFRSSYQLSWVFFQHFRSISYRVKCSLNTINQTIPFYDIFGLNLIFQVPLEKIIQACKIWRSCRPVMRSPSTKPIFRKLLIFFKC